MRFTSWERQALTRLSAGAVLPWAGLQDRHGHPDARQIRRLFRWLEDAGVVAWDPFEQVFRLADRPALARLLRWDGQRRLTARYRAGKVTGSTEVPP